MVVSAQDERELVQSLMGLRETAGVEADIFTTAQTIINLALVHVKNTTVTATPAAVTMQVLYHLYSVSQLNDMLVSHQFLGTLVFFEGNQNLI